MLAERLGVTPPTVRTWLHRNCYPRLSVKKIASEFGWDFTPEQIKERFEFEWARPTAAGILSEASTLRSAFFAADRERERVEKSMISMGNSIEKLCSAMGERDLLITLSATVTPPEMERSVRRERREAIVTAVRNGATLLYLRASQELTDEYQATWGFDRLRPKDICIRELNDLRDVIAGGLLSGGMPAEMARECVEASILQYFVRSDLPYLVPGVIFQMFRAGNYPSGEENRMVIHLPENPWATVYLSKADYFSDRFRRSVCQALKDEQVRLTGECEIIGAGNKKYRGRIKNSEDYDAPLSRDVEVLLKLRHALEA